jgi:imidazolonepropionase-like amidohydrolase
VIISGEYGPFIGRPKTARPVWISAAIAIGVLLGLLCSTTGRGQQTALPANGDVVVFSHVNVLSMKDDRILADQTVVVRGGKIVEIDRSERVPHIKHALQIDSSDKYLMPGLADLHVHLFSTDDLLSYAAYGVTTVLNMNGEPAHLRWREQVRRGSVLGPTIYSASPTVDGLPPLNEMFVTEEKPSDAAAFVGESKRAGYDFIKLYGTLRPDVFRAILEAAQREKIPVVGHINRQVGALEVLKSSQVLAAHLEDLIFARFDHPPSDAELEEFVKAFANSHITVTPNLNVNPANIAQLKNLGEVLKSTDAQLLPPAAYSQWMPANNRNDKNDAAAQIEQMTEVQKALAKLVRLLDARGVPLVLGTDAAPYGFPGLSAHQELSELVEAGFSPYRALLTATRNAGRFVVDNIPNAPRFGTIEEGSEADLMLLSANPLLDIANTRRIEGVMLKGRWLSSAELGHRQAAMQAHSAEIKRQLEDIDAALESGDVAKAEEVAAPLRSESTPWIAEWVLIAKARKLQSTNLPAALQIARWNTRLYPDSFAANYVLANLLFQDRNLREARQQAERSRNLQPHNAATLNLLEKIHTVQEPLRFVPAGTYKVECTNDQSGETQTADLLIEATSPGVFNCKKTDPGDAGSLCSVWAGGDRMFVTANAQFGPMEFRMNVASDVLTGYWAGPFGRNGKLSGKKVK